MKTTKEQRAELRARTPTSQQSMYQLYVRRAELHAVLDDLDEAEARAERYREVMESALEPCSHSGATYERGWEHWVHCVAPKLRSALAETEKEKP